MQGQQAALHAPVPEGPWQLREVKVVQLVNKWSTQHADKCSQHHIARQQQDLRKIEALAEFLNQDMVCHHVHRVDLHDHNMLVYTLLCLPCASWHSQLTAHALVGVNFDLTCCSIERIQHKACHAASLHTAKV